jgi:hypothetical protein
VLDVPARNVLWGTDAIWWASPQWSIDAFKRLRIPPRMQEKFGYPPLTARGRAASSSRSGAAKADPVPDGSSV